VRCILINPSYRGELVWGRLKTRDAWGQRRHQRRERAAWTIRHDEALRIVPEDLWCAAHERLRHQREAYLRHRDGRLWGRPTLDKESPYLLVGFGACGVCGAAFYLRSGTATRGIGRPKTRSYGYQCQVYYHRGASACPNGSHLPREATEAAVLQALDAQALDAEVTERFIVAVDEQIREQARLRPEDDAARRTRLAEINAQLGRFTDTIALGAGAVPALVKQMTTLQRQRDALAAETTMATTIAARLPRDLRQTLELWLADWREALYRNIQTARQVLRRMLVGRIVFTPTPAGVEFVAEVAVGSVIAGFAFPQSLVSRPGIEPGTP
jgi:hypothetical protein